MLPTIGIIGGGLIAGFHVGALQALNVPIAAIADPDQMRGAALATQAGAAYMSDYHGLLADPTIDAIIIATPNHTHYAIAVDVLESGKHVFCEKPMTTSPQDAADLVARAQLRPDQIFHVGYMKRFNAGFRLIKELLPQIGDVLTAHVRVLTHMRSAPPSSWHGNTRQTGGGVLAHSGSHLLDVTRFLFGDPAQVTSRVADTPARDGFDRLTLTLMDMTSGLPVYFSTIGVGIARLGHAQQGWEETIEIIGTDGRIHLSSPNWQGTLPCVVTLQLDVENEVRTIYPDGPNQWQAQMQVFLDRVAKREHAAPTVIDGYKVDELISAIYASGRERRPRLIEWRC